MGDEEDTGTPVEEEEVAPESVDEESAKRRREGKMEEVKSYIQEIEMERDS